MKKWLIALLVFLLLFITAVYVFIPSTITIASSEKVKCTEAGARRVLADETKWMQWMPVKQTGANKTFANKSTTYKPGQNYYNSYEILINKNDETISSGLEIISLKKDSIQLYWYCALNTSLNPFERVKKYFQANELEDNMKEVLQQLQQFLSKDENIYNAAIRQEQVKDTILMSEKKLLAHSPSPKDVYQMLDDIKKHIQQNGATETGYPMLHIKTLDSASYQVMVAIPVNKKLTETSDIVFKRMVPGKILVTEVKGGDSAIKRAFNFLQDYVDDNRLQSPAISFESLITNRVQTDSAQWITRLYYPVL